jgi:flagellar hook assembly protein FlgD
VLEVFDLRGRRVKELFRGELGRGPHAIRWDGTDHTGARLASGTYLVRLERQDGAVATAKVALLK